jgi:glycosyltransferase involved in cell wall biosynthesis
MINISIIIPVYNLSNTQTTSGFKKLVKHLDIAIGKADKNMFDKIIVINDKPDDNINELVRNIFRDNNLSNLLVFENNTQTLGQAATRNKGAKLAKGDYLHFIDQDDFINELFYSSFANSDRKDITISLPASYYSETDITFYPFRKRFIKLYKKASYIENLKFLLVSNIAVSPGQYIVSKEVFFRNGMFPDLKNRGCDDYGFIFNLTLDNNCSILFKKEMIFYYTIHNAQNRKSLDMSASIKEFYKTLDYRKLSFFHKFIIFIRTKQLLSFIVTAFFITFFYKTKQ